MNGFSCFECLNESESHLALGSLHYDMLSAKQCKEKINYFKEEIHDRNILKCNNSCVGSKERKKNYKAETSPVKKNIFLQKLATRLPISEHSCQPSIPCWNIIWRKKVKVIHEMFHCPPPHKLMQPLLLLLSLSWGYFLTYFLSREVRRQIACWDKMLECLFFFYSTLISPSFCSYLIHQVTWCWAASA